MSETSKWRELTVPYCFGFGLDIGSAGDPVHPMAIQVERTGGGYCDFFQKAYPPQLYGDGANLYWFKDQVLDFVYSSHLIEDYSADEQAKVIEEWCRVIRPNGHLVILAPEKSRWANVVAGSPSRANPFHKHEPEIGELQKHLPAGWRVIQDRFCDGYDYSLLLVARRELIVHP